MVDSRVYPGLERKPGGPDNWVEEAGQLPDYIERIAKHLHYEQGMSISRSIAVAINTVKRWAAGGLVAEHGTKQRVTAKTQALAAKAVAEWEALKARAGGSGRTPSHGTIRLSSAEAETVVSLMDLAERVRSIEDPTMKAEARAKILDLALTKDGRKSFKKQGKWGHGFVPLDAAAREAKAKGSPIAAKRINRLFGGAKSKKKRTEPVTPKPGVQVKAEGGGQERASAASRLRNPEISDAKAQQKIRPKNLEESKGGGRDKRSERPWEEIPEGQRTIRNGKRYVLTTFRGKQQLTEWTGSLHDEDVGAPSLADRRLSNITAGDAAKLKTGRIKKILEVKGLPDHVRERLNRELTKRRNEGKLG